MGQYIQAPIGDLSPGIAPGGQRGQYLRKASDIDYDTDWEDVVTSGGSSTAASYVHNQATAAASWTMAHNLGFKPSVELLNSGSQEIEGDVVHLSQNVVVAYFTTPIAGFARLN
jgi:hypothetical protein